MMQGYRGARLRWLLRPSHVLLLMLALLMTGLWPSPSMATSEIPVEDNKEFEKNGIQRTSNYMKERETKKDNVGVVAVAVPTPNTSPSGGLFQSESTISKTNIDGTSTSKQDSMSNSGSFVKEASAVPHDAIPSDTVPATIITVTAAAEPTTAKVETRMPVYSATTETTPVADTMEHTTSKRSSDYSATVSPVPMSEAPVPAPSSTPVPPMITTPSMTPLGPLPRNISAIIQELDTMCRNLSATGITIVFKFKFDKATNEFVTDIKLKPEFSFDGIIKSFFSGLQNKTWSLDGVSPVNLTAPFLKDVFKKSLSTNFTIHLTSAGLKHICDSFALPNTTTSPLLNHIPNRRVEKKALNALAFLLGSIFTVLVLGFILWACSKYCSDTSAAPVNWTSWSGIATNIAIQKSNVRAWYRDLRGGQQRTAARYSAQRDAETGLLESNFEQFELI